ncbi:MAG: 1-aminocyclopropane-1-carboxylate deaminase [Saprospiraceae bacterium]|nr:1-aminocyclopropane-1-carboxylate deaminase [Saprospiraceae bacterium]
MQFDVPISPLEAIAEHPGKDAGIALFVKRDDLLHPDIQGNKWRKLAPVIAEVKKSYPGGIVTFGGPFSNHLQAVAAAGRIFDIRTFGIVRGKHADLSNPTLSEARKNGMTLFPIAKSEYDACKNRGEELIGRDFPQHYVLSEGGATQMGIESCAAIVWEIDAQLHQHKRIHQPLYICVPAGTGCTAAGVVDGFAGKFGQVLVFPVVNKGFESHTILRLLDETRLRSLSEIAQLERRFSIVRQYEFGGFAKLHQPVLDFVRFFRLETGILLDPIYTAKMMYGVYDMLIRGDFKPGSTVVAVHTGGLQGWKGFEQRYGIT